MTQETVRWAVVGTGGITGMCSSRGRRHPSTLIPCSERLGAAQRIAVPEPRSKKWIRSATTANSKVPRGRFGQADVEPRAGEDEFLVRELLKALNGRLVDVLCDLDHFVAHDRRSCDVA